MKIAEGLELIQNGWIRKPKGFRVRFHRQTEAGMEAVLSPPSEAAPLDSDVTAWRYAWKLYKATESACETGTPEALYNITVVDDRDHRYRYYETGKFETYNPKDIHGGGQTTGDSDEN